MDAHHLGRLAGLTSGFSLWFAAARADHQIILMASIEPTRSSRPSCMLHWRCLKSDEGLVAKIAAGGKRKDNGGDLCGSHNLLV